MYPHSRRFSSSTPLWLIFFATTSLPLSHGPSTKLPSAAAPIGPPFDPQHSILHQTIGSYRALPSPPFYPLTSLSSPRALQNKVFPQKREFLSLLQRGILQWCKYNGLPSMPKSIIQDLGSGLWSSHLSHLTNHITRSSINNLEQLFPGAVFHCEDKHASPLRIFCPCLYHQAIEKTFLDPEVFAPVLHTPQYITSTLVDHLLQQYGRSYPWAIGKGRQLPSGYILAKKKKAFTSGRPIISFVDAPFRPMLNILARLIFQLIPIACPDHFATGDVYHLLHILRQAPEHGPLRLYNQDLAGFFTSIDQQRFLGAWRMLLDLLRPHMNVSETEVFSVYPGRFNNPGDLIKGRTFRRLNVTRKILIKDIPSLLTTALNMQTFCLGHRCLSQRRGSPMGSPLSPALCLMVVSISHQRTNLGHQLQDYPHQSPSLCSPHSLCRQPPCSW